MQSKLTHLWASTLSFHSSGSADINVLFEASSLKHYDLTITGTSRDQLRASLTSLAEGLSQALADLENANVG